MLGHTISSGVQWLRNKAEQRIKTPFKNHWLEEARQRALVDTYLRWRYVQEHHVFNHQECTQPIKKPTDYKALQNIADGKQFEEKVILTPDGHTISIWYKPPANEEKPIFVAFHGRTGHWADIGVDSKLKEYDRHFRLHWLKTMADTGAGVLAVHMRGYGASNKNCRDIYRPMPGEKGFRQDVGGVINYLDKIGIDASRIIVTGESLGGAIAAIMAEEMTKRHKPPAVLGSIASFTRLTERAANELKKAYNLRPRRIKDALRHRFESLERLQSLVPSATFFYVAHAEKDPIVPSNNLERLEREANRQGIITFSRMLKTSKDAYEHVSWDRQMAVADMMKIYEENRQWRQKYLPGVRLEGNKKWRMRLDEEKQPVMTPAV